MSPQIRSKTEHKKAFCWLMRSERRKRVVANLHQPLTVKQTAELNEIGLDSYTDLFKKLSHKKLVECLNKEARQNRVYSLTQSGVRGQRKLRRIHDLPTLDYRVPDLDWNLYGWACFRHRAAVVRSLTEPLQPAAIKRKALAADSGIRMSANNARDVMYLLKQHGIARPVQLRKKKHLRYELTDVGKGIQSMLLCARFGVRRSEQYRSG